MPPAPTEHGPQEAVDSGDDVLTPEVCVANVACVAGQRTARHTSPRVADVADVAGKGTDAAAMPRVAGVAGVAGPAPENHMQPESDTHTKLETLNRDDVHAVVQWAKIAPPKGQLFYWARAEHVDDLRAVQDQSGLFLDDLIAKVRGIAEGEDVRRLTALADLIEKGGGHG